MSTYQMIATPGPLQGYVISSLALIGSAVTPIEPIGRSDASDIEHVIDKTVESAHARLRVAAGAAAGAVWQAAGVPARGREPREGQLWAHICWILPGEPITAAPAVIDQRLPYADLAELDGQPYNQLPHRPGALLTLPPMVAYAGQVVLLRGWRHARGSWWAHLARLTVGERDDKRRAVLTDLHAAAASAPARRFAVRARQNRPRSAPANKYCRWRSPR
ncbi:hypothetical protein HS041_29625 [Planomonospora sp. ID67723]|uniref:hypothetical protein n=1 Tax=Planomonospora sp. ID67723 TaxID=2738134 RepID=UPI0018C4461E|nr:hypothetical protein [Planomonospora sp. ID67723]MBG0831874.1 hypothetical protein [Planomonospora sp. ID67723]